MLYKTCTAAAFLTKVRRGLQGLAPIWTHGCAGLSKDAPMVTCACVNVCTHLEVKTQHVSCSTCTSPFSVLRSKAPQRPTSIVWPVVPLLVDLKLSMATGGADIFRTSVPNFPLSIVCYQLGTKTQSHTNDGKVREGDPDFSSTPSHNPSFTLWTSQSHCKTKATFHNSQELNNPPMMQCSVHGRPSNKNKRKHTHTHTLLQSSLTIKRIPETYWGYGTVLTASPATSGKG